MSIYDNAGVALIPSGYKAASTDNLYSVLPANGNGDFNATRGSTATRVNKDGLIESVATNVPRLDYPLIDGVVQDCPALLLEPQRSNSLTYSELFSDSYWTKTGASVTSGFLSPDGGLNAFKLVESIATSTHELEVAGIAVVADKYTISLFAKADERGKLQVKLRNYFAGDPSVIFDLENGSFEQNLQAIGSMTLLSNGFYKCTFTTVLNAIAGGNAILNVNLVDEANQTSYAGNGTSGVYIYGAQLEQGSYPTSYIKTSGSAATRSADVCNGSGTSAEFNDSEGVLFAEFSALYDDGNERYIEITDGTTSNRVVIRLSPISNQIRALVSSGGTNVFSDGYVVSDTTETHKVVVVYKQNDFALWIDGVERATDTSGIAPTGLDVLNLSRSGLAFYGKTKQLMTFKTALTDSELETLTSWDSFNAMATSQLYTIE